MICIKFDAFRIFFKILVNQLSASILSTKENYYKLNLAPLNQIVNYLLLYGKLLLKLVRFSACMKVGSVLFNNALNTFYLRLYGIRHMVKDHSDSKREEAHGMFYPVCGMLLIRKSSRSRFSSLAV